MKRSTIAAVSVLSLVMVTGCSGEQCESGMRVAGECADGNAGRVVGMELSQPVQLAVMVAWPDDGVQPDTGSVLLLSAYQANRDELRITGGIGRQVEGTTHTLDPALSFDVAATESELGIYTEPFSLEIPMADGAVLALDEAILFELVVSDDAVPVPLAGKLIGVISPDTAEALYVKRLGMSALQFLRDGAVAPDFDLDGDGTEEAWVTSASFTTELSWWL